MIDHLKEDSLRKQMLNTDVMIESSPSRLDPQQVWRSSLQTDCEPESKWRTHPLQRRTKLGKKNSPKPLNGTASLGAWGEIIRRRLLFFYILWTTSWQAQPIGICLGAGRPPRGFRRWAKQRHIWWKRREWSQICSSVSFLLRDRLKIKSNFSIFSHLEQVLPARKLARGGARPGLGTMSTSEGNFVIATFFEAPFVIVCTWFWIQNAHQERVYSGLLTLGVQGFSEHFGDSCNLSSTSGTSCSETVQKNNIVELVISLAPVKHKSI